MTARTAPEPVDASVLRAKILIDVTAEADRIRAADAEHRAVLAELERQAVAIRTEHTAAAEAARAAYRAVPQLPEIPDGLPYRNALHDLVRARARLVEMTRANLADALPEIVTAWEAARLLLDEQAQVIAQQAAVLADGYAGWHALVHDARQASERDPITGNMINGPSTRMRPGRPRPMCWTLPRALTCAASVPWGRVGSPSAAPIASMVAAGSFGDPDRP